MAAPDGRGGRNLSDDDIAEPEEPPGLCSLPWRTGRHNNRTMYAVLGTGDHYEDVFIGTLDSPELVAEAVAAHNRGLAEEPAS